MSFLFSGHISVQFNRLSDSYVWWLYLSCLGKCSWLVFGYHINALATVIRPLLILDYAWISERGNIINFENQSWQHIVHYMLHIICWVDWVMIIIGSVGGWSVLYPPWGDKEDTNFMTKPFSCVTLESIIDTEIIIQHDN